MFFYLDFVILKLERIIVESGYAIRISRVLHVMRTYKYEKNNKQRLAKT